MFKSININYKNVCTKESKTTKTRQVINYIAYYIVVFFILIKCWAVYHAIISSLFLSLDKSDRTEINFRSLSLWAYFLSIIMYELINKIFLMIIKKLKNDKNNQNNGNKSSNNIQTIGIVTIASIFVSLLVLKLINKN